MWWEFKLGKIKSKQLKVQLKKTADQRKSKLKHEWNFARKKNVVYVLESVPEVFWNVVNNQMKSNCITVKYERCAKGYITSKTMYNYAARIASFATSFRTYKSHSS